MMRHANNGGSQNGLKSITKRRMGGGGGTTTRTTTGISGTTGEKSRMSFLSNRFLLHVLSGLCCFYAGLLVGMSSSATKGCKESTTVNVSSGSSLLHRQVQESSSSSSTSTSNRPAGCPKCPSPVIDCADFERILKKNPKFQSSEAAAAAALFQEPEMTTDTYSSSSSSSSHLYHGFYKNNSLPVFPPTLDKMFVDYGTVNRKHFMDYIDIGVPPDDTRRGSEDVLILYSSTNAKPTSNHNGEMLHMDAETALENCQQLKVILTQPWEKGKSTKCMAIVPQWESYNIYKYMRAPKKTNTRGAGVNSGLPLRFVARSLSDKGTEQNIPDYLYETEPSFNALVEYLTQLPKAHEEMKTLLEANGISWRMLTKEPLIVQVCNKGQAELLVNFVCSAHARGLDTSRVFLFATDEFTYDLCQKLGLKMCYYNEEIFGGMPERAAKAYGDSTFAKIMMAKVYCVHMVLTLGFPVLFQDVDLIWYKNPLPYFEEHDTDFDVLFQDDGARTPRYAPYSPNTGFYFVRYNSKTLFLFNRLLKMGDTVARYKSHQAALTAAINENVSWIGLKVRVYRWGQYNIFPGGVEYHRRKDLMRDFIEGKSPVDPYIFHMSWTENKDNKKLFFQQFGEWRVGDDCWEEGLGCCLAEPNIVCHYRDKPSIIPCRDSPTIDKNGRDFWPEDAKPAKLYLNK